MQPRSVESCRQVLEEEGVHGSLEADMQLVKTDDHATQTICYLTDCLQAARIMGFLCLLREHWHYNCR
jgi:hypothetical protein